ncbi:MAG: GspH/FimT family pseudopilin [Longimicrobiales bacterium]
MRCDAAPLTAPRRARSGFTIIELLIVMSIISIVLMTAVPPLMGVVRGRRLENATQSLIGDLRLARTEAIRRNRTVFVARTGATTYTIEYVGDRTLTDGVAFNAATPDTLRFTAFGPAQTGMVLITLHLDGDTSRVRVSAGGNASAE